MSRGNKITAAGLIGLIFVISSADSMSLPVLLMSLAVCLGMMEIGHKMSP